MWTGIRRVQKLCLTVSIKLPWCSELQVYFSWYLQWTLHMTDKSFHPHWSRPSQSDQLLLLTAHQMPRTPSCPLCPCKYHPSKLWTRKKFNFVCVCVCVCVCVYIYICVCVCVCVCVWRPTTNLKSQYTTKFRKHPPFTNGHTAWTSWVEISTLRLSLYIYIISLNTGHYHFLLSSLSFPTHNSQLPWQSINTLETWTWSTVKFTKVLEETIATLFRAWNSISSMTYVGRCRALSCKHWSV